LARRVVDISALTLALIGVALLVALFTYSPADPSLNSASTQNLTTQNWLGEAGAFFSDFLIQIFGFASFILPVAAITWSIKFWKERKLARPFFKISLLAGSLVLLAAAFARIPSLGFLPHIYAGGAGGALVLNSVSNLSSSFLGTWSHSIFAGIFAFAGIVFLSLALPISRQAWANAAFISKVAVESSFYKIIAGLNASKDWIRKYNDPDYIAPPKKKVEKTSKKKVVPVLQKENKPSVVEKTIEVISNKEEKTSSTPPKKKQQNQRKLNLDDGDWEYPTADLLNEVPKVTEEYLDEEALKHNAEFLENVLQDFNVEGEIVSIHPGPVVTLYEFEPAPGTKSARIVNLTDDIARSMSAVSVRASVIPGRNVIGIEIPNKKRQTVYMREMLEMEDYDKTKAKLPLVLGKNIGGKPVIADLAKMPHLLVAGTTGSGKSVAVNTMIMSLIYKLPPEKCRFIMIDPKMLELSVYNDIPHLLSEVVTEPGKAVVSLKWAVAEMEKRYRAMSKLGVRNIDGYNARMEEARKKGEVIMRKVQTGFDVDSGKPVYEDQPMDMSELPYIVILIDEFADLMLVAGKDVEGAIQRLAQMARAAGIHMIMATQRPSVDVITGVIKANFPTRISFQVTSKIDSRTILGDGGAEQLLGMGDMLYMAGGGRLTRVHGPFTSDDEVESVVNFLKLQGEPNYLDEVTEGSLENGMDLLGIGGEESGSDVDELYDQAVALVAREQKASTSYIQRYLQIGYNRAARIIEEMERQGVVGPANHVGKREILVSDHSGED